MSISVSTRFYTFSGDSKLHRNLKPKKSSCLWKAMKKNQVSSYFAC